MFFKINFRSNTIPTETNIFKALQLKKIKQKD